MLRDAPLDIWGGGGARVFVACKLFFLPKRKKQSFFLAINVRQFFFMFRRRNEIFLRSEVGTTLRLHYSLRLTLAYLGHQVMLLNIVTSRHINSGLMWKLYTADSQNNSRRACITSLFLEVPLFITDFAVILSTWSMTTRFFHRRAHAWAARITHSVSL